MDRCRREPTLADVLADPLVHAVMKADRVDARELETSLRALGRKLRERTAP